MTKQMTLTVNGRVHRVDVEPETSLLIVLRNDLGLKGAKPGCGLGQCGSCNVILDGRAVPSCQIPVGSVGDREILTIEGLGTPTDLDPLQQAFQEENAAQCGFCTSGMIISARALLDRSPHATETEIGSALDRNLCRCGSHDRILRAVGRAAGRSPSEPAFRIQVPPPVATGGQESFPHPLIQTPDLDDWVRVENDGTITVFSGKAELGQDIRTSFAMIAADELDVSLDHVHVTMADTEVSPNEGYTASSMSLETSGNAIRYACAQVRGMALTAAAVSLHVPISDMVVAAGRITDTASGRSLSYRDLFGGKRFDCPVRDDVKPKNPDKHNVVGRPVKQGDILQKVTGAPHFVHDLDRPGMVHARVVRPPQAGACLVAVDIQSVIAMPGVLQVVRDGSFLAVVATLEEQAIHAADRLRRGATWEPGPRLVPQHTLFDHMLSQADQASLVVDGTPTDDPVPAIETPAAATHTLHATYYRPYHMHASIGPSAAVAEWVGGKLTVWTHSQGVYPVRDGLAQVLSIPAEDIRLVHTDGPGCYGHNGTDDAALDAALVARAVPGRPVALKWSRHDEHTCEPYGTAMVVKMQASLDRDGEVIDWNHDVWGHAHSSRPRAGGETSGLLGSWYLAKPFLRPQARPSNGNQGGLYRNSAPLYAFPRRRIVKHFLEKSPLRVSALRGLGSYANIFAVESFMDELAAAAHVDPVEFRLRHLSDERARAVIEAAAEKAGPRLPGLGRGVAFSQYKNRQSYLAVILDVSVNRDDGGIRMERAVVAVDAGQIVNPDGLANQVTGAFLQSASWTLMEQVMFDEQGVTSVDWRTYPILRVGQTPKIETVLLNRPGFPYLGIGEGAQGPAPAAIANAVQDAVGIRLRHIPFTPDRVMAALRNGEQ